MSGFDVGNQRSLIGVTRKGGIDIIDNEASNRLNPSLVSFGNKQRYAGEAAATYFLTNVKNSISQIKRFIGRRYSEVKDEIKRVPFVVKELPDDEVGIEVNYNGQQVVFTPVKILAILLGKLKQIHEDKTKIKSSDVVIGVPAYFTDAQRRAMLNAAEIAGLNCLRLLNETTATALDYGFYKLDWPEQNPVHVMFIDIGHSATTCSIVDFTKGKLKVINHSFDSNLGGRDIDDALLTVFAEEFKKKYKIDVYTNPRALLRLRVACEKLKKDLSSGVSEARLSIESLMEDKDVTGHMTRVDFESLISPLLQRMVAVVANALSETGLTSEQLQVVEIVGAVRRMPAVQTALKDYLKKDLSMTRNDVESVARGCALQCAILSPIYKVREFSVIDFQPYPIKLSWHSLSSMVIDHDNNNNTVETESDILFARGSSVPSTKIFKLKQLEPLEITTSYETNPLLPSGTNVQIATFTIPTITPTAKDPVEKPRIEIRFRLNPHGILVVESAELLETIEVDVPTPTPAPIPTPTTPTSPTPTPQTPTPSSDSQASPAPNTEPVAPQAEKKCTARSSSIHSCTRNCSPTFTKEEKGEAHNSDCRHKMFSLFEGGHYCGY